MWGSKLTKGFHTHANSSGLVESKLRQLILKLENTPGLALLQPYIRSYERNFVCQTDEQRLPITAGTWPSPAEGRGPLTTAELDAHLSASAEPSASSSLIFTTSFYIGMTILHPKGARPHVPTSSSPFSLTHACRRRPDQAL